MKFDFALVKLKLSVIFGHLNRENLSLQEKFLCIDQIIESYLLDLEKIFPEQKVGTNFLI
ncbi:unnamed protein product [Cunninghamella echinulata]